MEDASKEFQIFLSPTRDFQQPYRESAPSKHRIVPVISKILSSSSSSSTFTLNQRRSNVYKAVSGVSFQDTDVGNKKPVSKKERRDKKRERRKSYVAPITEDNDKKQTILPVPGARRSRSLTSMESAASVSTDLSKNPPEITHPFAQVILYNQSSGRKSRYARMKERRRSSSHARNGMESKKHETTISSHKTETQQPVRPRRARSASRSRKPLTLITFSSENNLDIPSSEAEEMFHKRCEKKTDKKRNSADIETLIEKTHNKEILLDNNKGTNSLSSGDIDFSVNDTDWKKYDILVTQKLDTLLKKKEEPEGGYFSLERDETEELEKFTEGGDHFQRDNCNESIYVAQVVTKDINDANISQYDQYIVEEIYSEIPFLNQGQEVGFVDDEGLYEEIFFDRGNEHIETNYNNNRVAETSSVNILVSPNRDLIKSVSKPLIESDRGKIEKSASTTIVYIGGDLSKPEKASFNSSTSKSDNSLKQSASCNNLTFSSNLFRKNSSKKMSVVDIVNNSGHLQEKYRTNNSPWCGCYNRSNQAVNHTSSCIQSRSGLLSTKCTFLGDSQEEEPSCSKPQASNDSSCLFTSKSVNDVSKVSTEKSSSSQTLFNDIPEPDYELSDIDLDMFAPKTSKGSRFKKNGRSVSETHLNHLSYLRSGLHSRDFPRESKDITSPKTFRGFLEDSIFNPPDTESVVGDVEDLIIREDQVVTCITDSSSSSDESDSTSDEDATEAISSPWLEAQNEFEYVTFKEDKNRLSKFVKRRKGKKIISIPKLFGSSSSATNPNTQHESSRERKGRSDFVEIPTRPSRRRKNSDNNQLSEAN